MTVSMRWAMVLAVVSALTGGLVGAGISWLVLRQHAETPPAEPPKTTAELLVGKWKRVKSNTKDAPGYKETIEFTAAGEEVTVIDSDLEEVPIVVTGRYRMEGNTIWAIRDPHVRLVRTAHAVAIESISEDKLVLVDYGSDDDRQVGEYERVK